MFRVYIGFRVQGPTFNREASGFTLSSEIPNPKPPKPKKGKAQDPLRSLRVGSGLVGSFPLNPKP